MQNMVPLFLCVILCHPAFPQAKLPPLVTYSAGVLRNNSSQYMTACAFWAYYPAQPLPAKPYATPRIRCFDTVLDASVRTIPPHSSLLWGWTDFQGTGARFAAAVLQDGTTYGDADALARILERRGYFLQTYEKAAKIVEDAIIAHTAESQLEAEFKKALDRAFDPARPEDFSLRSEPYADILNSLSEGMDTRRLLTLLRQKINAISNSKPPLTPREVP